MVEWLNGLIVLLLNGSDHFSAWFLLNKKDTSLKVSYNKVYLSMQRCIYRRFRPKRILITASNTIAPMAEVSIQLSQYGVTLI